MADSTENSVPNVSPYLKQVRVRDYPPLRDAKVDFKPELNIIIGKNGTGKTRFLSLLSSLADLYQTHFDGIGCELVIAGRHEVKAEFKERPDEENNTEEELRLFAKPSYLLIEAAYGSKIMEGDVLEEMIEDLTDDFSFAYSVLLVKHGIPTARLPITDERVDFTIGRRTGTISLDGDKQELTSTGSRFPFYLIRTVFHIIRGSYSLKKKEPKPLISVENARELIAQAIEEFLSFFNNYLPLYSPISEIRCNDPFQVYRDTVQEEIIVKGIVLEYKVGQDWLPFSALSDGTKRLFYIITEVLSPTGISLDRESGKIKRHDKEKIILLEEPELGIHPDQLQKLLSLIREISKEHQVIMTTHSPQVLNMLTKQELDRITICELDPEKGTQFRKLSRAKQAKARAYMRDNSYLSDFWLYSNLEAE